MDQNHDFGVVLKPQPGQVVLRHEKSYEALKT